LHNQALTNKEFQKVANAESFDLCTQEPLEAWEVIAPGDQHLLLQKHTEDVVDSISDVAAEDSSIEPVQTPQLEGMSSNTIETAFNATVTSGGDFEISLARLDLAGSVIAKDIVDVGDSLAVLAVGGVVPERRSNGATTTTLRVRESINTINTFSTTGDATCCRLIGRARRRLVTFSPGDSLRTTSAREGPAHTIAFGVGSHAGTLRRVCTRGSSITVRTLEVTRTLDATEGSGVRRIFTLLFILLALDELGEIIMGAIRTKLVYNYPCHRVASKEAGEDG